MLTSVLLLVLALVLVAACGFFVAAEFSLVTVDRTAVDQEVAAGDGAAVGLQHALRALSSHLSGAQLGITLTNLGIGWIAEPAVSGLIDEPLRSVGVGEAAVGPIAVVVGLTVSSIVTMVFGELVPKNIALALPMWTAKTTQAPLLLCTATVHSEGTLPHGTSAGPSVLGAALVIAALRNAARKVCGRWPCWNAISQAETSLSWT